MRHAQRPDTWAMPVSTGVVDADDVAASVAHFGVATEGGRSALGELGQDAALALRRAVALDEGLTVLADDIGHFGPMFAHVDGVSWVLGS